MPHREIVEDICCEDCRGTTGYCTLKEIILHSGFSDRTLEQLKCVELFKWQESAAEGFDIGWAGAHKRWVERGHAAKFAEIFCDGMHHKALYEVIMSANPSPGKEVPIVIQPPDCNLDLDHPATVALQRTGPPRPDR